MQAPAGSNPPTSISAAAAVVASAVAVPRRLLTSRGAPNRRGMAALRAVLELPCSAALRSIWHQGEVPAALEVDWAAYDAAAEAAAIQVAPVFIACSMAQRLRLIEEGGNGVAKSVLVSSLGEAGRQAFLEAQEQAEAEEREEDADAYYGAADCFEYAALYK